MHVRAFDGHSGWEKREGPLRNGSWLGSEGKIRINQFCQNVTIRVPPFLIIAQVADSPPPYNNTPARRHHRACFSPLVPDGL